MWMRARVGAQFITIGFMMPWFVYNYNSRPSSTPPRSSGDSTP
jgi:hypothetical protein